MEIGATAGAFALALASVELAKFTVTKLATRINGNGARPSNGLSLNQAQQLHDLHEWHKENDEDGRKLWYTPRSLMKQQTKLLEQILGELRKFNGR